MRGNLSYNDGFKTASRRAISAVGVIFLFVGCSTGVSDFDRQAVVATVSCRDIADDAERLACLDNAADELAQTLIVRENIDGTREPYVGAEEPVATAETADIEEAVKVADTEEAFGSERLRSADKSRPRTSISAKIVEIVVDPFEKITVKLENGQVWRQLSGDDRIVRFPGNSQIYTAEIKRGAFGSYLLTIAERGRTVRVRRIE